MWTAIQASWFTKKDCQGLSVFLRYAQIRAMGLLFKHLGPGVLEGPPSPFATKGEEMEEWALAAAAEGNVCGKQWTRVCARAEVNAGWLFPPPPYTPTQPSPKQKSKDDEEQGQESRMCPLHSLSKTFKRKKGHKRFEYYLHVYAKKCHFYLYITVRVSHLHENGRLEERDKPRIVPVN